MSAKLAFPKTTESGLFEPLRQNYFIGASGNTFLRKVDTNSKLPYQIFFEKVLFPNFDL